LTFALLLVLLSGQQSDALRVPLEAHGKLALTGVEVPSKGTRYEKLEIRVGLTATYTNPFHPAQIELLAQFKGPNGLSATVPGFFYQGFSRRLEGDREVLAKGGEPTWLVRFTPPRDGRWSVRLRAVDRTERVESEEYRFEVADSDRRGFVHAAEKAPAYLQYSNGQPFYGVGLNLAWPGHRGTFDYDDWFAKLAANGGNLVRVWSHSGWLGLEWSDRQDETWRRGTYYGLGRYSLDNAWLLDQVLEAAERHGVKVILCLGTYGELKEEKGVWNEQLWHVNPYNVALGGPCKKPDEIFTNLRARALYRQRLQYTVARWAYSPALLAWELWNEVDAPSYWVHEMAKELTLLDPYNHIVTTSYGAPDVWKLEYVGMVTAHVYGDGTATDMLVRVRETGKEGLEQYHKPAIVSEFGIDSRRPDGEHDAENRAINMRSGMWQAAASGCAAGTLNWWWDSYVAAKDLWEVFKPFAEAVSRVDWTAAPMHLASPREVPEGIVVDGVLSEKAGFFWLRREAYDWKNWPSEAEPTLPFLFELPGIKDGRWSAVWWDTLKGEAIDRQEAQARSGVLNLKVPSFTSDTALLLSRR
jgi:hypothetical protein